jgi:hypothetical protein
MTVNLCQGFLSYIKPLGKVRDLFLIPENIPLMAKF